VAVVVDDQDYLLLGHGCSFAGGTVSFQHTSRVTQEQAACAPDTLMFRTASPSRRRPRIGREAAAGPTRTAAAPRVLAARTTPTRPGPAAARRSSIAGARISCGSATRTAGCATGDRPFGFARASPVRGLAHTSAAVRCNRR